MEFQELVRRRRMVRRYAPDRPVPEAVVEALLDNARRAPSAGFSQGFAFLVLDEAEDIARFRRAATPVDTPERWFSATFEAPLVIVPCSNKSIYLERYALPDKGHTDRSDAWWPSPYWDIDTGFATLLVLLTAVDQGLGACFFGIPKTCLDAVHDAFGIPAEFHPIGAISAGYPDEAPRDLRHLRKQGDEVVHRGRWGG